MLRTVACSKWQELLSKCARSQASISLGRRAGAVRLGPRRSSVAMRRCRDEWHGAASRDHRPGCISHAAAPPRSRRRSALARRNHHGDSTPRWSCVQRRKSSSACSSASRPARCSRLPSDSARSSWLRSTRRRAHFTASPQAGRSTLKGHAPGRLMVVARSVTRPSSSRINPCRETTPIEIIDREVAVDVVRVRETGPARHIDRRHQFRPEVLSCAGNEHGIGSQTALSRARSTSSTAEVTKAPLGTDLRRTPIQSESVPDRAPCRPRRRR